jgi:hypothetical protein
MLGLSSETIELIRIFAATAIGWLIIIGIMQIKNDILNLLLSFLSTLAVAFLLGTLILKIIFSLI